MAQLVNHAEIRNRIMALSTPVSSSEKQESDSTWIFAALISMMVLVASVTGLILSRKSVPATPKAAVTTHQVDPTVALVNSVSGRVSELERRIDVLANRQWLLGLATNENMALLQQFSDQNKAGQKYLFFDEDWKFDRMPEHLKLSDQEKRDLSAYIRHK